MEVRLFIPPQDGSGAFIPVGVTNAAPKIARTERFFTFGDFEVSLPNAAFCADRFVKYLFVLIDKSFWGVVLGRGKSLGPGDDLRVFGLDVKGLADSRVTFPPGFTYEQVGGVAGFDAVNGPTETCMKHYVEANFFQAASPSRGVEGLVIAPDQGRGLPDDRYMSRFEPLSGVLEELGRGAGIGYAFTPVLGSGEIVFDCVEGADRSAVQSVNPRIVFEVERRNISSMEYLDDDSHMRNLFYASLSGSQFVDDTYTATVTRDDGELPGGIYRWEQHLDISASHPVPGAELDELRRLALARAESYVTVQSLKAQVVDSPYRYGVDYFLGDIVTVRCRGWGVEMHTRLTEMKIDASAGGVTHTATFGDAPIYFIDRLRRQIRGG